MPLRIKNEAQLDQATKVLAGDTSKFSPGKLEELRQAVSSYLDENSPIPDISTMGGNFDRVEGAVAADAFPTGETAEAIAQFPLGPGGKRVTTGLGVPRATETPEGTSERTTRPGRQMAIEEMREPSDEMGALPEMQPPPEPLREESPAGVDSETLLGWQNGEPILRKPPERVFEDPGLRNLSKDSRFDAPIGNFDGSWMDTKVAYEPSVNYVKDVLRNSRELQRIVGLDDAVDINGIESEDHPAYQKTADAIWMMRLDEAKKVGYPLLRASQQPEDSLLKGPLGTALEYAVTPAAQVALNFERGSAGGLLSTAVGHAFGGEEMTQQLAEMRDEAHPGLSIPSQIAGALSPSGLPNQMVRGGMSMMRAAPVAAGATAGASFIPRALQSAGIGSITGMGMGAVQDVADIGAGVMQPEQFGEHSASDALWGGLFGLAGEGLGSLASMGARRIQMANPDIIRIEKAGGVVDSFGARLPKQLSKMIDDAHDDWVGSDKRVTPTERAVDLIEQPLIAEGRKFLSDTTKPIERVKEAYYATPEAKVPQSMRPLWEFTVETIGKMKRNKALVAQDLPANDTAGLRTILGQMSDGRLVESVGNQKTAFRYSNSDKGIVLRLSADEAEELFGKAWVRDLFERNGPWQGTGRPAIEVRPMVGDARTVDTIVNGMYSAAKKAVRGDTSLDESIVRSLGAKAREARDGFKGNQYTGGRPWSKVMSDASESIQVAENTLKRAGMREDAAPYTAGDLDRFRRNIAGLWQGENRAKADEALMFLANRADVVQELKSVAALVAKESIGKPGVGKMATPTIAQGGPRAALHPDAGVISKALYPRLRDLGSSLDSGAGAVQETAATFKPSKGLLGLLRSLRGKEQVPTGRLVGRLGAAARPTQPLQQAKEDLENLQIVIQVGDMLRQAKEDTAQ